MSLLNNKSVKKVRAALAEAGFDDTVIELEKTARSAEDAAKSLGVELGSIVKSLVFAIDKRFVVALLAGDHKCKEENLPRAVNLEGAVSLPGAEAVRGATGFSIGGVPPVGLPDNLPMVIDTTLKRFEVVYAAAGHPHCIFATTVPDLKRMTGAIVSYNISEPI